jgi:predicted permease
MDTLLQDIRFAFRSLRRSPGLVLVATLSLALGIAVNVTIYAAVDILLLRPQPFEEPHRLVQVWSTNPSRGWEDASISLADFRDWRSQSRTMSLSAYRNANFNLSDDEESPERVNGSRVSPEFFSVLGARPAMGRVFGAEEEQPGRDGVAVISDAFWRRRFDADPGILEKSIRLDGQMVTIIGVMPAGFTFPQNVLDVWAPLPQVIEETRDSRYIRVLGRLAPGATLASSRAEIEAIAGRLAAAYPATNAGMGARVITLQEEIVEPEARQAGTICLVAVFFVLLIACANVANLLLARGATRSRELSVRAALGAGRGRLVRQLMTESFMLAAVGCALGLVLSLWGIQLFRSVIPSDFPRVDYLGIDAKIAVYALVVSVMAGLVFGTAPAIQVTRGKLSETLAEGGRGGSSGVRHRRLRTAFVVGEVALAQVLLISAGLMIKGALRMQMTPLGFDRERSLAFGVTLGMREFPDTIEVAQVEENILAKLREIPGVDAAGMISQLPLAGGNGTYYTVEGEPPPPEGERPVVQYRGVLPGFSQAMGTEMARGRNLGDGDRRGAPLAIVVNEAMVRRHWPDKDPLGRRITMFSKSWEIVGVSRDVREFGPDDPAPPTAYFTALQHPVRAATYVVRSGGDPAQLSNLVRAAVGSAARNLPVYDMLTLTEHIRMETAGDMIMAKLLGTFGAMALLLSLIGVYGVMAYTVAQRERELGIRRVLGARVNDISWLVLSGGLRVAGLGAGIGLLIALGVTRTLSTFLQGVSAFDPIVFTGVTLALVAAALAATTVPARRATAVDPGVALRAE